MLYSLLEQDKAEEGLELSKINIISKFTELY